ncbi:hypothetical protein BU24DRAFT_421221 [Aaosphaeria arxii CBS 175.79]|uniref:GPI anchored serine-threonine rich protein n=1 Tax=Aaosphaeria arxii CBS 175.79 TaxID=1450172 RepID=A0A6A5XY23_9PLEO|nr:uncharacterized protein BU24DRAFT_421221 [Aaosphaeria arxii CBS 175.79]KAF2018208.1 hypothetical protein BU24DRAFT_421221 [Aaosphaeria arxii CBS 175.79]
MRYTVLAIAALSSLAAAQTSSAAAPASTGGCDAQNIVDACKEGIQKQIDNCKGNDWICLCDNYTNLATCYNNCPKLPEKFSVDQQVRSYCDAAAPAKAASSSSAAAAGKTAPPSSAGSSTPTATNSDAWSTATGTNAAQSATNSPGAAGALIAPAGGVMALLMGVAGLL